MFHSYPTVILRVVFSLPLDPLTSGCHSSAVLQSSVPSFLRIRPSQCHLLWCCSVPLFPSLFQLNFSVAILIAEFFWGTLFGIYLSVFDLSLLSSTLLMYLHAFVILRHISSTTYFHLFRNWSCWKVTVMKQKRHQRRKLRKTKPRSTSQGNIHLVWFKYGLRFTEVIFISEYAILQLWIVRSGLHLVTYLDVGNFCDKSTETALHEICVQLFLRLSVSSKPSQSVSLINKLAWLAGIGKSLENLLKASCKVAQRLIKVAHIFWWRHNNGKQSASAREHWCDVSCDIPYSWFYIYST